MDLASMSCDGFSEALAAKQSTPGGGSAASYAGALGCALASMACQFTLGKPKYAEYEAAIADGLKKATELRLRLLALMDLDAQNLEPLTKAYGLSREDPSREEALNAASAKACEAPLAMMETAAQAVELFEMLYEKGAKLLQADTGCGAMLCASCMKGASLNVYVNVRTITDSALADQLLARCNRLLEEYVPRAEAVFAAVTRSLQEG